jgi:hypothetical protein
MPALPILGCIIVAPDVPVKLLLLTILAKPIEL